MTRTSHDAEDPVRTGSPVDTFEIPENPLGVSTDDARTLSVVLFRRLDSLAEGTPEYSYVRNTLVELNLSLVKYAARRFRSRSEPFEDIVQVGTIGLIKAINRYDVERGVEFATFAVPTITGEMKRFFRDTSWSVKVPRRLQEMRLDIAKSCDAMEQGLGRRPTDHELAEHLGISDEALAEGRQAANCYVAESLSTSLGEDADGRVLPRSLGTEEAAYELIEDLETLKPLLDALGERDRLVLSLRFGEELTQSQIGERLGISQMHVSRLLSRIMTGLRAGMLEDREEEPGDEPLGEGPGDEGRTGVQDGEHPA
ncbi:SigB/SigF/SigG family RNA polymerase sigma factor [Streptomyces manipurensis]|uniref:SigB/SigF/SigG family RNA polymerase sigma factor n=1 Tax=Streptomyces manipurensis TaxID=1077945 RepID=UPI003C6EB2E2